MEENIEVTNIVNETMWIIFAMYELSQITNQRTHSFKDIKQFLDVRCHRMSFSTKTIRIILKQLEHTSGSLLIRYSEPDGSGEYKITRYGLSYIGL